MENRQHTPTATRQEASASDISGNSPAQSDTVGQIGESKQNGLGNMASATGKPTPSLPLGARLTRIDLDTKARSRKKKGIIYLFSALILLGLAMYFITRVRSLIDQSTTGIRTPDKPVRLDSTTQKLDALMQVYEKQAKSHYQDSLENAIEKEAMGHIVMDWNRLYDIRQRDAHKIAATKTLWEEGNNPVQSLSEQSLSEQSLSPLEDSVNMALAELVGKPTSTSSGRESKENRPNLTRQIPDPSNLNKKLTPGKKKRTNHPSYTKSTVTSGSQTSIFNVVHGSTLVNSDHDNNDKYERNVKEAKLYASPTLPAKKRVILRAVVHGNHKIFSGSKVTFRLMEDVTYQGKYFKKNTILVGIATFRSGRVNFSEFHSRSLSSVSASHGAVESTALPMVCYDTDMVAGISVSDQSPVETQTRQAGTSAVSDAANDASYAIPYGSLARAASSLTRGVASGKRQQREKFIDLADNYPVLLELEIDEKIGAEKIGAEKVPSKTK